MNLIFLLPTLLVVAKYLFSAHKEQHVPECCA